MKKLNSLVQQQNANLKQNFLMVLEQNIELAHLLFQDFDHRLHGKELKEDEIDFQIKKIRTPSHQKIMSCIHKFNKVSKKFANVSLL